MAVHADHVLEDGCRVKILIGLVLKVDEEPVFQFARERQMMLMCAAAQGISIGDHKRISFPFLASSRTDRGSLESLSFPQVRRIRLRKPSKLCRPKATRFRTLTLLFRPSLRPLDFPYFQLFWM